MKKKNKSRRDIRREQVKRLRAEALKRKRTARMQAVLTALLLVICSVFLLLLCLFDGTKGFSFERLGTYFQVPLILFLNWIPIVLFMAVLYFAVNRAWIAWLSSSVFFLLLTFINYFKVALRGEPLVVDDLLFVGDAAGIAGEYSFHIPLMLFVSAAIVAAVTWMLYKLAPSRIPKKRWWVRIAAILLCIGFGAFSWTQWYTDYLLYHNTPLAIQHTFSPWRDEEITEGAGLFWSLLRSLDEAFPPAPEGYSDEAAEALLAQTPDEPIPQDKRINVIATMLESFSDLSEAGKITFTNDPYKEFHDLQAEAYHGTLLTDSVGGGTINAERAFLTGFTYRQPTYQSPTSSFVRYFAANGYAVVGAHPGNDWFYSRDKIMRYLGFEEYLYHEGHFEDLLTEANSYHGFLNDEGLFAERCADFADRDKTKPYFSFSVTYQGHSPYDEEPMTGAEYVSADLLDETGYRVVNNYLNSVAETGKQMAAFVDSFREEEAPVVLVFFGDHKPTLGDSNRYLTQLGAFSSASSAENRFVRYSTPYLIWANDAAKEVLGKDFTGQGDTISPCYLMSELFDCCGWEGPAWLRYQRTLRDTLPVMQMGSFVLNGSGLTLASDTLRQEADKYKFAEYYMRNHLYTYEEMK